MQELPTRHLSKRERNCAADWEIWRAHTREQQPRATVRYRCSASCDGIECHCIHATFKLAELISLGIYRDRMVSARRRIKAWCGAAKPLPETPGKAADPLSAMIAKATNQASTATHRRLANSPILPVVRELNERHHRKWQLKAEDHLAEDQQRWWPCRSPAKPMTSAAGMMASERVISRRSQGFSRRWRNPSMTIWPARVPVSVEFCPEQSSADGKKRAGQARAQDGREQLVGLADIGNAGEAAAVKYRGAQDQNRGVDEKAKSQARPWNRTRRSEWLRVSARRRAPKARVCTMLECRYRLWGITVAPRMPMAR